MAHELDMTGGRANIAFLGSRGDVWHRLGQEMQAGMTIEQWAEKAGLNWTAIKVPAIASLEGPQWDHIEPSKRFMPVEDRFFNCRSDNGYPLGYMSDIHQNVQPLDVLAWFQRYIGVDPRFALDVAGSLKGGRQIWATAIFNSDLNVAGDRHRARVLMSTTYDCSGATTNQMTMTRVVCNNTLHAALADKDAVVRTRHNTRFDAAKVGAELAQLAQGCARYKVVGDALAQHEMAVSEMTGFFKSCLDIPFEAKAEDVSTRKLNQFAAINAAYRTTLAEGAPKLSAWAALQAITRYVDHDRTSGEPEKRFLSTQFGSGAALKGKAMELLMPRIADKVAIAA